ncbi:STAS domain-containing protein [Streptomyces sp. NBC_01353]|uniref:STAS domain-containing protein n=1 Tax=Streptomyces sp. NBC_01353 TaxID=2903835 RepID=UPI002E2F80D4|nr:STAS domain-containing protein [Streptomyces sp. NBC_01353]
MTLLPSPARPADPHTDGEYRMDVSVNSAKSGVLVTVRGEIDLDTVTDLRTTLLHAVNAHGEARTGVVLDLSEVTFCDSIGLNALLRARQSALDASRTLTITAASPAVTRLLEITGAAPLFRP